MPLVETLFVVKVVVHAVYHDHNLSRATLMYNWVVGPWPVSCPCPEPRWFVGGPTSMARDSILVNTVIE